MVPLSLYLRNSDTSLNGHFDDASNWIVVTEKMSVDTRYFMDLKQTKNIYLKNFKKSIQTANSVLSKWRGTHIAKYGSTINI